MARCAVIWDWGGVLMRTEDYRPRHAWDARLGLPPGSVERVVHGIPEWEQAQLGRLPPDSYWGAVAKALGLSPPELADLQADFYRGDRPDARLLSLIERLRAQGCTTVLLSNNILPLRDEMETLGIGALFDAIVISAQIGVMKPHPDAYRAALAAAGVKPGQAILIDDSDANIKGAAAVGLDAVLFYPDMALEPLLHSWVEANRG